MTGREFTSLLAFLQGIDEAAGGDVAFPPRLPPPAQYIVRSYPGSVSEYLTIPRIRREFFLPGERQAEGMWHLQRLGMLENRAVSSPQSFLPHRYFPRPGVEITISVHPRFPFPQPGAWDRARDIRLFGTVALPARAFRSITIGGGARSPVAQTPFSPVERLIQRG